MFLSLNSYAVMYRARLLVCVMVQDIHIIFRSVYIECIEWQSTMRICIILYFGLWWKEGGGDRLLLPHAGVDGGVGRSRAGLESLISSTRIRI